MREVFGNSQLLLNPLYMQFPICGYCGYRLAILTKFYRKNDEMKLHLDKVHFKDPIGSSKRGNYIAIKILSFKKR